MPRDMVQIRRSGRQAHKGPDVKVGRSQLDRSHGTKTTFDSSRLVPILVDEVYPGDTMTCRLNGFIRIFSPLDAPIMDNITFDTNFFFVPNRLIWDRWEDFNGAHTDDAGAQDIDYTIPRMADGITVNHDAGAVNGAALMAMMGIPHGLQTTEVDVSAMPLRAYNKIYNAWFRDQNVRAPVADNIDNGPDAEADYFIRRTAKRHDYFTTCLPYLQKGDAQEIALGGIAPIWTDALVAGNLSVWDTVTGDYERMDTDGVHLNVSATGGAVGDRLYANLALATVGISVNALRLSVSIQRLLETDARGGTRYVEMIKSHFGVTSPDFRLQRPEYLGGGKGFINVSPVANTSTTATEDQGELRGVGTGVISGHSWSKSFVEHGWIIGVIRARADLTYFQGLDKMWSRQTRYDFYLPALANLGEQSVLNKELFISNSAAIDDATFGFQARWEELRMKKSTICGLLNPDATGAISHWHLAEDFSSLPVLNITFIEDHTPMVRVTTTDTAPDFMADIWFDYKCARPIPIYAVPSISSARF